MLSWVSYAIWKRKKVGGVRQGRRSFYNLFRETCFFDIFVVKFAYVVLIEEIYCLRCDFRILLICIVIFLSISFFLITFFLIDAKFSLIVFIKIMILIFSPLIVSWLYKILFGIGLVVKLRIVLVEVNVEIIELGVACSHNFITMKRHFFIELLGSLFARTVHILQIPSIKVHQPI